MLRWGGWRLHVQRPQAVTIDSTGVSKVRYVLYSHREGLQSKKWRGKGTKQINWYGMSGRCDIVHPLSLGHSYVTDIGKLR